MKIFRNMLGIVAMAAFCLLWSAPARANDWSKKTVVTFNQPVEVPNIVLPAGTYVFKRADTTTPNLVQITNADETRVYATLITARDERPETTNDTVITFEERSADSPRAIKEWFYPGDTAGEEFLYPDHHLSNLAKDSVH
jgi:hypothetical protein